ncbi:sigma-B regulation protein RsbU (phosphoserine phosphatase) [Kaistia hirudinis]|uniref:Sigma-B regulation protein RsbU (Phosphoserine phosphatase) n=1 Tax=Kaistia hirudinis TaxID=1293440 RepID=A0A840ATK8_9HYPH|nr:sigma-B regulation protein RsbU (phosphoserine phosphatase) [Kaistia hirudinis]
MTLSRRLVLTTAIAIALAILVTSIVFGLLGRRALVEQAEGQAAVVARIIAESARLTEVSLEETEAVVGDILTSLALTADHIEGRTAADLSDRLAEIVARGGLDSIWLIDDQLNVVASSIGGYSAVLRGEEVPVHLSRQALLDLASGERYSADFGPSTDGVHYVGVRAPGNRAIIVGQPVAALDAVREANSVPVLMRELLDRDNIISIRVVDDTQKLLASAGPQAEPASYADLISGAIATNAPSSAIRLGHFWVAAPIHDIAGIVIGAAVIEMSNHRLNHLLWNLLLYGTAACLIVIAIGVTIATFSARRIARPVEAMTQAAQQIDARTFAPESLDGLAAQSDELGTLARVFRHMAIEVQRREEHLEQLVRARTKELEQKNQLLEEAARRVEAELMAARSLQAAMLPQTLPADPAFTGTAAMLPAREMGGDFYDFFALDDRRLGIVIADVSGKGVSAAFFMAISRTVLHAQAREQASPGICLARSNDALCAQNPMELFVTAFYGILDAATGQLTYANGGHNPPLAVRRSDGVVEEVPRTGGLALGVMPEVAYTERTLQLQPGDTLFLYTDGISEAMDGGGREFTEARLKSVLSGTDMQSVDLVLASVTDAVSDFVGDAPQSDDITCLVIRYLGQPETAAA